ncbi:MAG: O-antigen ligase family protein, partial [bacterium]
TQLVSYSLILSVMVVALGLSFTRSAWIGAVGGLIVMLAVLRMKWAVLGGLLVLVTFLLLPAPFRERFYTSFDLRDTTTKGRVELLNTGAELILANPWFGVGPRMVPEKALDYRGEIDLPTHLYQHFHNNIVQIAAEMGIPAALCWIALWIWVVKDCLKMRRTVKNQPFLQYLSVTCICILVAFHLAGLFEYNFGDSEIAILLFFFVTIPYTVDRRRTELGP